MSDGDVCTLHPVFGSYVALPMQTKEHGFQAKAATEFAKLYKFQADLEEETGNACFVGLSAVATAQQCIRLGNHRAAARVQSEFRISDRRFWWLKVRSPAAVPLPSRALSSQATAKIACGKGNMHGWVCDGSSLHRSKPLRRQRTGTICLRWPLRNGLRSAWRCSLASAKSMGLQWV